MFFFEADDGIRAAHEGLEFRRVLFRSQDAEFGLQHLPRTRQVRFGLQPLMHGRPPVLKSLDTIAARSFRSIDARGLRPRTRDARMVETSFFRSAECRAQRGFSRHLSPHYLRIGRTPRHFDTGMTDFKLGPDLDFWVSKSFRKIT